MVKKKEKYKKETSKVLLNMFLYVLVFYFIFYINTISHSTLHNTILHCWIVKPIHEHISAKNKNFLIAKTGSPYEERFSFTARGIQNSVDNPFKMKLH